MDNVSFVSETVKIIRDVPGEREIHRQCGFRISHFQRSVYYPPRDRIEPRRFEYYSLCHLIEGRGWLWTPGEGISYFEKGQGVLASPHFIHHYGGYQSVFKEDFIGFSGPVADYMYRAGVIRDGIVDIGSVRRLIPIQKLALNLSDRGQLAANGAFQGLLYDLYLTNSRDPLPGKDRIDRLLERLTAQSDQWWTVSDMAEYCNLSENQFRRRFRERTGMGPKYYYDTLKMKLAADMLLRRNSTLEKISRDLGYRDSYHLSKVFKRIHGINPEAYRGKYRK